jgi:hypothetical protein
MSRAGWLLLGVAVAALCTRQPRHVPAQWTRWFQEYRQWRGNRTQSE